MTLITRCPACETLFKVVPDQLRISQGWVRCGQCAEVFDASSHLFQSNALGPVEAPAVVPPEPSPADPVDEHTPEIVDDMPPAVLAGEPADVVAEPFAEPETDTAAALEAGQAHDDGSDPPVDANVEAAHTESDPQPLVDPIDPIQGADVLAHPPPASLEEEPAPVALAAAEESGQATSDAEDTTDAAPPPEPEPEADRTDADPLVPLLSRPTADQPDEPARDPVATPLHDHVHRNLSFLREARAPEPRWRSSLRRASWVFAGIVLLGALALQVAVHERDRIASSTPAAIPWLQALCAPLRCSVQPMRQIESIVIDGASFSTLRDGRYRLGVTVRNRAHQTLALPAIELSLTDVQEQAVVRRVLLPAELGASAPTIPADGEWASSVDLQLADRSSRGRVVGYRLLAFYP